MFAHDGPDLPTPRRTPPRPPHDGPSLGEEPLETPALAALWGRVKARLRAELGEDIYNSWFPRMDLVALNKGAATLSVPTQFLRSWVASNYADRILRMLQQEQAGVDSLAIVVKSSIGRAAPGQPAAAPAVSPASAATPAIAPVVAGPPGTLAPADVPAPPRERAPTPRADDQAWTGSPLDRRMTLGTFLVGGPNQAAHAAVSGVLAADPAAAPLFNPLFLHAGVGLGKTHLVQGLAQALEGNGRRVIYLTAERFMFHFAHAVRAQTALEFKERLRGIDALIVDDVQFLNGRTMHAELCHILNALIDAGKQVVIAADRAPMDLDNVDERMRSRLKAGLVVEIGALDEDLRRRLMEARIAAAQRHLDSFRVAPEVVAWIARHLPGNGRDLEGAVNRMLAHATLTGQPVDMAAAESAIRDLVRLQEPKRVKVEDIQRLVASHYRVSKSDILSKRRTATVVRPRQVAMYLSKTLTPRSLPEIGRLFGGRDHTTVLHAVRKIEALASRDTLLANDLDLLRRMLQE